MQKPGGVLLMMFEVLPEWEDAFNRWYDETHLPEMLAQSGIRSAHRYVAASADAKYLTIYELDHPGVLNSEAFIAWRDASESTREMQKHLTFKSRVVYRGL